MAYADKSCDMRRCCIAKGGHVRWEGVEIDEVKFLLNERGTIANINTDKDRVLEIIREWNDSLISEEEPYILLYQDTEDCDWDVKSDYVKKLDAVYTKGVENE